MYDGVLTYDCVLSALCVCVLVPGGLLFPRADSQGVSAPAAARHGQTARQAHPQQQQRRQQGL
jgi:hypothetical protein